MQKTYFTEHEARNEVGHFVEALADFPSVPRGSRGTVVKANRYTDEKWLASVKWDLPRPVSVIEAMVGDTSLNFFKRSKPVTDQFCKSEYERLVRVVANG